MVDSSIVGTAFVAPRVATVPSDSHRCRMSGRGATEHGVRPRRRRRRRSTSHWSISRLPACFWRSSSIAWPLTSQTAGLKAEQAWRSSPRNQRVKRIREGEKKEMKWCADVRATGEVEVRRPDIRLFMLYGIQLSFVWSSGARSRAKVPYLMQDMLSGAPRGCLHVLDNSRSRSVRRREPSVGSLHVRRCCWVV